MILQKHNLGNEIIFKPYSAFDFSQHNQIFSNKKAKCKSILNEQKVSKRKKNHISQCFVLKFQTQTKPNGKI